MGSGRLGLSAIDKREIWSRWKAGQTLHEIGRAFGKCHNAIRAVLLPRGGGWGNTVFNALIDCVRLIRQFPYEGDEPPVPS